MTVGAVVMPCDGPCFECGELQLRNCAGVEQLLGSGDLRGGPGCRHVADGRLSFLPSVFRCTHRPSCHPLAPCDDVEQCGQERYENQAHRPDRFPPAVEIMVAVDIGEYPEQHHEVGEEDEDPQGPPDDVPEILPETHQDHPPKMASRGDHRSGTRDPSVPSPPDGRTGNVRWSLTALEEMFRGPRSGRFANCRTQVAADTVRIATSRA